MFLYHIMGHPSRFATAVSIVAVLYLYTSEYSMKDKLIFFFILTIGIFSLRSKFYGFMIVSLFFVFIMPHFNMKINIKNTIVCIVLFCIVFLVTKNKIFTYFNPNSFGSGKGLTDLYARMALYYFSYYILLDFIPFGSGFASYATYASSIYYSPIYEKYGIDKIWGLSKDYPAFMCDTYYPALSEFGIVGVILFLLFWWMILSKAFKWFKISHDLKSFTNAIIIVIFFLIECTTDSTFTHNRGLMMLMILGLIMSNMKRESNRIVGLCSFEQKEEKNKC
jgi:hypothetical protein